MALAAITAGYQEDSLAETTTPRVPTLRIQGTELTSQPSHLISKTWKTVVAKSTTNGQRQNIFLIPRGQPFTADLPSLSWHLDSRKSQCSGVKNNLLRIFFPNQISF